ncbi:S-adenosyl-L-methionine-dependent methyltransferase, partial [Thamnocephalis sphaerospora]
PVRKPRRLLDIGTGTGAWLMKAAADFPKCDCTGIDTVRAVPDSALPDNCTFIQMDLLRGTKFEDGLFDYIRQRALLPAIPLDRWTEHARECFRLSRPGALVEWIESDNLLRPSGPALDRLNTVLVATAAHLGWATDLVERLPEAMTTAGLRGVETRRVRVPVGDWSEDTAGR